MRIAIAVGEISKKQKVELTEMVDRKIGAIKMPDLGILKDLKGDNGEDSEPEDVAKILLATPEFMTMMKPADGHTPTKEEILALIKPLIPVVRDGIDGVGKPGPKPTDAELLSLIKPLLVGKIPTKKELADLIRSLMPVQPVQESIEPETGAGIVDKINALPVQPEFQIDASHIKNLPKPKKDSKGGSKRGGGDILMYYNLSALCDGNTRSFTIPSNRAITWVGGTDAPGGQYAIGTDVTGSGTTTLTISSSMAAPTPGATLHLNYIV